MNEDDLCVGCGRTLAGTSRLVRYVSGSGFMRLYCSRECVTLPRPGHGDPGTDTKGPRG